MDHGDREDAIGMLEGDRLGKYGSQYDTCEQQRRTIS